MNFFEKLGDILKIGKNGTFGQSSPSGATPPFAPPKETIEEDSEEIGPSSELKVDKPIEKSYQDRAREMLGTEPKLSTADKISRGLQLVGASVGGSRNLSDAKDRFAREDNAKFGKQKAILDIANDLAELDKNQIQTNKLKLEIGNEESYKKAAIDPSSDVSKLARSFAADAVNLSAIKPETKKQLLEMIGRSTADQLAKNKFLDQLGVTQKINLDSITAANKINDEKRAANKDSRESQKLPYEIESEKALAGQRNAAADQNKATAKQVEGLNKAEVERDKAFAKKLDSDFAPAIQTMTGDLNSFKRIGELVSNGSFKPDDLSAIAEAYNSSKGDLGLFADSVVKLDLSPGAQEFGAIVSELAPRQRPPGSGTTSDLDLRTFFKSLGVGLTDKNALLRRISEKIKANETNLKNNTAKYDYYSKNGTLKGFNDFGNNETPSTGTSKYKVEEVKEDKPKKRKYQVEELN